MRGRALALGGCIVAASFVLLASAFGAQPAEMSVSPSSRDFGSICVGTSTSRNYTITNTASQGSDPLVINAISQTSSVGEFKPQDVPTPAPIEAQGSASFSVTFSPTAHGSRQVTYKVDPQNDGVASDTVTAKGAGIDRRLTADRANVSFGDQRVGTRSPTQTLIVRNPGADTVHISVAKKTGAAAGDFRISAPAQPFSIAAGNFVTVTMSFQPTAAGLRKAALELTSDACGKPKLAVGLIGTGVVGVVGLEPNPVDVGASPKGTESRPTAVTLTNGGGAPLTISAVQVIGHDAEDFVLEGLPTMPATVAAGDQFVFNVRMTPSKEGARVAQISVISDDPAAPTYAVDLRGTGGKAGPSPTPSTSASASPTRAPTPTTTTSTRARALAASPNDDLAIVLVIVAVFLAFLGLIVIRRFITPRDDED